MNINKGRAHVRQGKASKEGVNHPILMTIFTHGGRRKTQKKKTCNVDLKIHMKILSPYPPTFSFILSNAISHLKEAS